MQTDWGYGEASGLPPYMLAQAEAGAHPGRDASSGLRTAIVDGKTWAQNPAMNNEWQLVYTVQAGGPISSAGLSGLAEVMYGDPSQWKHIYNVPQNKALQGADPNTGLYVGDIILIPGLVPSQDPGGTQETPGNGQTPVNDRDIVFNGRPGNGDLTTVSRTTKTDITTTKKTEWMDWWTPGRTAIVAGVGVGTVVLITWAATSPKRTKRRRRRRRTRRRRR